MYMKEGEPVLGGPQVSPGNVQPTNPGVQPVGFETLQNTQTAQATPLVSTPSPTFAPSTPPVGTQLNNPAPLQPAPTSPQIPPQPLRQFSPQSTTSPAAPNMGDIILSDTPPQKSKKGLIIWLIVLAITLITIGVIFVIFYIQPQSDTNIHKDPATIQNKFNKYANYVLYGEDSAEQIQDFKTENVYAIDENTDNNTFLKNADNLYSAFLEDFIGSDYDGKASTSLLSTNEYYNFLIWKNDFSEIDKTELLQIYMDGGLGVAKDYIKNYYNDVDQSNSLIELLAKYDSEYAIYMVEEWAIYDEKGCRQDNSYDTTCIMNITNDEKIQNFAKHLYELET